jgi:hypothetical protein
MIFGFLFGCNLPQMMLTAAYANMVLIFMLGLFVFGLLLFASIVNRNFLVGFLLLPVFLIPYYLWHLVYTSVPIDTMTWEPFANPQFIIPMIILFFFALCSTQKTNN